MDNKWSRYYSAGENKADIDTNRTIYKVLCDNKEKYPDRIALEHARKQFTYTEFLNTVDNTAVSFKSIGIGKGDAIALCINGIPATAFTVYAASAIGAIVSMMSTELTPDRFKTLCISQNIKAVVMTANQLNDVADVLDQTSVKSVIVAKHTDYYTLNDKFRSPVRKLFPLDTMRVRPADLPSEISMFYWKELLGDYSDKKFIQDTEISPNSPVVYLNGASVTGRVLSAALSSRGLNEQASIDMFLFRSEKNEDKPVRILSFIDRFFSCGLCLGIHSIIASGNTALFYAGDLTRFPFDTFGFYKPDIVVGYPGLLMQMAESKLIRFTDISYLQKIISCGNVMNTNQCCDLRMFLDRSKCNARLERLYGIDETGAVYIYNPVKLDNDRIFGIPLPGVMVKIMDPDSEAEMRHGEQGQICVCTPAAMTGYVDNDPATEIAKKRFRDGRVWICTGDTGHEDDNGFIYFDGNTKRIIERDGTLIYPYIIEECILGVSGVKEACAVTVDDDTSPYVVAVVAPEDDYLFDAVKLDELKRAIETECNLTLPAAMRPDEIEFRAYLPKENFGKNDHDVLRAQIEARRSSEDHEEDENEDESDAET